MIFITLHGKEARVNNLANMITTKLKYNFDLKIYFNLFKALDSLGRVFIFSLIDIFHININRIFILVKIGSLSHKQKVNTLNKNKNINKVVNIF